MNETKVVEYIEAMLEAEPAPEPHASLFLTGGRHEDAVVLAHVLGNPEDLTLIYLTTRVRHQAERMWRKFGRDIDISVSVLPDGFINVYGDLRHASAYIGEIIP